MNLLTIRMFIKLKTIYVWVLSFSLIESQLLLLVFLFFQIWAGSLSMGCHRMPVLESCHSLLAEILTAANKQALVLVVLNTSL